MRSAGPRNGILWALAVASAGCSAPAPYVSPSLERVQRAWTLVIVRAAPDLSAESEVIAEEALRAELAAAGRFVPLQLPEDVALRLARDSRNWQGGPPLRVLVGLSREHGVDALALVSLHDFDPYPPQRLALSIEIHSTVDGTLLFSHHEVDETSAPGRPAELVPRDQFARRLFQRLLAASSP